MSNLIATDLQGQEVDSSVLDLFELTTVSGTFYFHSGLGSDLADIQFRDKVSPFTVRTYNAIPMILDGVEMSSSGAPNRPTLSIANVTNDLKTELGITNYDKLVGATLVRRQTLEKYLVGQSPDQSNPPIEMPSVSYRIDRVSRETNLAVTFELAVIYDLEGVQLPRRKVVGKYCSWMYQGYNLFDNGGCVWSPSSVVKTLDSSDNEVTHEIFFDENDSPIVASSWLSSNSTAWTHGTAYTVNSYVVHLSKYYRCEVAHTGNNSKDPTDGTGHWKRVFAYTGYSSSATYPVDSYVKHQVTLSNGKALSTVWKAVAASYSGAAHAPAVNSSYWVRADLCGKTLQSCKCRFQATMVDNNNASAPSSRKNSSSTLPFGAFPGTKRF